ncbi:hypothetical protein PF007_g30885 [Phytophthora fragariae]|uniref:Uncharacterized protein n=1 Tax=Phytophthora fragariae TaxID=53985 RepID=A0A6A3Q762_9STRA|nr:hypothetical protein PF007_g30885 [Phytophthora fragariae]KAE9070018.1 hypothetical protein PF006_g29447 [Phytophthora fragariae]KAE9312177.1 hypothetical protein PF001_g9368 [Phytophthora fragariae]
MLIFALVVTLYQAHLCCVNGLLVVLASYVTLLLAASLKLYDCFVTFVLPPGS